MAKIDYRNSDGEKLSSVTTIIGQNLGWNKGAMMGWAYNQGKAGLSLYEARDKAADIGTLAHLMINADVYGKVFDTSPYPADTVDKAENAFLAWLDWKRLVDFKLIAAEMSLVDNELGFGGTFDKVSVKDKLSLTDFKTGKAVYVDMWIQMSAYAHLWELHFPDQPLLGGYYILQLGKEDGSFSYHHKIKLDRHFEIFKHLVAINELHKEVK